MGLLSSAAKQGVKQAADQTTRSVMPAPQRFFDPEDKAFKPFLSDFDYVPGGRYLQMGPGGPQDITGQYPMSGNISVGPDGKPQFRVSEGLLEAPPDKKGAMVKTNLFKKKAGWKWTKAPKGYDPNPDSSFPLISVETRGKHYYALETDFPEGVDLARYPNSASEPRLRPTRKGDVELGKKVGEISVRGKKHPVYDRATVKTVLPAAVASAGFLGAPEDAEAAFLRGTMRGILGAADVAPKATRANLLAARKMEEEGVEPRVIYEQTGYFRGADGKMRFEVGENVEGASNLVGDLTRNPTVYDTNLVQQGYRGAYAPRTNEIFMDESLSPEQYESVLAHERQHALQENLGLAGGANTENIKNDLRKKLNREQSGLLDSDFIYNQGYDRIRGLSQIDAVSRYRQMARSGNLTGKRRLLVNNSNWYELGDDIRRELGPEPKRHRPKAEREQWLQDAWMLMANKIEMRIPDNAYQELHRLSLVPRGGVRKYVEGGPISLPAEKRNQLLGGVEAVNAGREILLQDPKAARKAIDKYVRVMDQVRDDAFRYSELQSKKNEFEDATDYELYKRAAGEVEARNVQTRLDMTPEERAESYPPATEDIERYNQIIVESPTQKAQRGSATPAAMAAAGGAGLLGAATVNQPSLAEQGIGALDAVANAASGLVAPILSAPSAITRYAADRLIPGVNFSAEEMAQARRDVEDVFDYQPRTELGQQYSNQALMALGGLLAPVVEASEGSKILGLLGDAYDYIGPKRRELVNALLDMSPL